MVKKGVSAWKITSAAALILLIISTLLVINNLRMDGNEEAINKKDESISIASEAKIADEGGSNLKILVENLDTVWAIAFLPDGKMLFTERPGRISIYDGESVKIVGEIDVTEVSESGLMGIATDPNFEESRFIYLYYTHNGGNRISRFTINEELRMEDEYILLDNIPSARFHDGGRLRFGPDGLIYATTGDATVPSSAQDINSLAGKILRMNKDGSVPEDNPFENYIWSYGHRNPQGIDWNDLTGDFYSAEHGPVGNDEVNIIIKGGNYGWPKECTEEGEFINPIRCFTEFTIAPGAIAFHNNSIYVAGLRGSQLRKLKLDESGRMIIGEEIIFDNLGRTREAVYREGYLYIGTSNWDGRGLPRAGDDKIIRIKI